MLTCGLIGLPGCGKSTLFSLLAGPAVAGASPASGEARRVVQVPDARIDTLTRHFVPRKTVFAQFEVVDIPGLVPGERSRALHFLESVRGSDALVFVLRGFGESPNPVSELSTLEAELVFADLATVENRADRLESPGRKTGDADGGPVHVNRKDAPLHALLVRVRDHLAEGRPFRELDLKPPERAALGNMAFLTDRPAVWVLNVGEEDLRSVDEETGLAALARQRGVPLVTVSARAEREIAELAAEEATPFLADLGLEEAGTSRLARAVYERLGLISFFTVGDDEVRAWTIRRGTRAREAAGKIHSDIERGLIRAEVVAYEDYLAAAAGGTASGPRGGTSSIGERALVVAREKALVRLEGRDYEVKDGDIVTFRFNV